MGEKLKEILKDGALAADIDLTDIFPRHRAGCSENKYGPER